MSLDISEHYGVYDRVKRNNYITPNLKEEKERRSLGKIIYLGDRAKENIWCSLKLP
jgi:hypothetical protein